MTKPRIRAYDKEKVGKVLHERAEVGLLAVLPRLRKKEPIAATNAGRYRIFGGVEAGPEDQNVDLTPRTVGGNNGVPFDLRDPVGDEGNIGPLKCRIPGIRN